MASPLTVEVREFRFPPLILLDSVTCFCKMRQQRLTHSKRAVENRVSGLWIPFRGSRSDGVIVQNIFDRLVLPIQSAHQQVVGNLAAI